MHPLLAAKLIVMSVFVDYNECKHGTDACDQNCQNMPGSYTCSCNSGYTLNNNGYTCDGGLTCLYIPVKLLSIIQHYYYADMNECSTNSTNSCQHVCVNTPGSYTCRCQTGFRRSPDGRSCEGESQL